MIHCQSALIDGAFVPQVTIHTDETGTITAITTGPLPRSSARIGDLHLGIVTPGFANTHSHLFHRGLRGFAGGQDFWSWRTEMYRMANRLEPEAYQRLALAVFTEMLDAGYTEVGEFHYLHHMRNGQPYPAHEMELAVARGAVEAGIRLTLLDTCYLHGGPGRALTSEQSRFNDGSVSRWLDRWHDLRSAIADALPEHRITLGAALHSVRAVWPEEMAQAVDGLPSEIPLHIHLSEQPKENADCLAATGLTPTAVLDRAGVLSPRTTVVHATHLTDADIELLAASGTTVSLCPTTEADLGDGLARIDDLCAAGIPLTIGTDENVVSDPFAELRMLESTARLATGRRGVVSTSRLWMTGTSHGHRSLSRWHGETADRHRPGLRVGDPADLIEVDPSSQRLAGVDPMRWPMVAAAADVSTTVVGGRVVPRSSSAGLKSALAGVRGES